MKDASSRRLRQPDLSRRTFLAGSAAAVGLAALPSLAQAQQARYRRWEISDPGMPANILPSYKKAIRAMLELEPTDPRNWHRNAMLHLLDCPHGNWWFLPWHRAYLGWFEQTCRELSEDADFALPYWDWTKTPRVPAAMFDDVLDPNHTKFIASSSQFQTTFNAAVTALYASFSGDQKAQLAKRPPARTEADFWNGALESFSDRPNARGLTAANPDLDAFTLTTVSMSTVKAALRVPTFSGSGSAAGFGSAKTAAHSARSGQGILESQPHNNVHGAIGGFMGGFFSSVDPIFYLHHGNLDRLWDVWTRRQQALQRPILPEGADLTAWSDEPFLFFNGPDGQPVQQVKSSDYAKMALFDYDYSPGSGEDEVPAVVAAAPATVVSGARVDASPAAGNVEAGGLVEVPAAAFTAAEQPTAPPIVAEMTLKLDEKDMGRRFRVSVTPKGGGPSVEAGTITIFGHQEPGEFTFAVPLPSGTASEAAAAAGTEVPLDIRVKEIERVAGTDMGAHGEAAAAPGAGAPVTGIAVAVGG